MRPSASSRSGRASGSCIISRRCTTESSSTATPRSSRRLALDLLFPSKLRFVGYLGDTTPASPARTRDGRPYVLVTTGGGGDGHGILASFADHLDTRAAPLGFKPVVVTGPLLSRPHRSDIIRRFQASPHDVEVMEFTDKMESLVAGAGAVICMAGYNTVTEILSYRVPALLVPREQPRKEQLIRARRLARTTGIEMCRSHEVDPDRIDGFLHRAMVGGSPKGVVDLSGIGRTAAELRSLLWPNAARDAHEEASIAVSSA